MTDTFLQAVSPVFTVDGSVEGALARDCQYLEVAETTEGLRTLTLWLTALAPDEQGEQEQVRYLDGDLLDFGTELEVTIGPAGADGTIFTGRISALDIEWREAVDPQVVVRAEDRLMDLRMTRRSRTYESKSDAEIADAIAREHNLGSDATAEGPTYDVVQQWNVSDLAFLRERASRLDAEVWVDGTTLCFKGRGPRNLPQVPTLVRGGTLLEARGRADLAHQRSTVSVSGYDAQQRDVIQSEADESVLRSEAAGGVTGPATLVRAFGDRPSHRILHVPLTSTEAEAWAGANMLRRGRRFVTVSGVTDGTPTLRVGSAVTLDRVGAPFDGDGYVVTMLSHTFDLQRGFRTAFEAERPFLKTG